MVSKRSLAGNPPPSRGTEDRERQVRALTTPVRNTMVTIEYVDADLGIADAREIETGQLVSLNNSTAGVDLGNLKVGSELMAHITRFQHAVKVTPVPR